MPSRTTIQRLLIAAFAISATSAPLSAQAPNAVSPDTTDTASVEKPGVDPRFLLRVLPAVGMGAAGAFLGGLVGGARGFSPDRPGALAIGFLAGATLGSAIGAAAPKGRGLCTENQRFWRGLAGASVGLAASLAIARSEPDRAIWLATIPVGSVMFMTRC